MTKPKITLIIIGLALLGIALLYFKSGSRLTSEDAAVTLNTETVSARVTGYVTTVNAENGHRVAAGDILVTLDPTEYQADLSDAKAILEAMQKGTPRGVAQSLHAARAKQSDPAELEQRLALAKNEELTARNEMEYLSTQAAGATLARRREESSGNPRNLNTLKSSEQAVLSRLEQAKDKLNAASQFRAQTERDLEQAKAILSRMDSDTLITDVLPAEIEAQADRVRQAELNLAGTEISAPVDGKIIMTAVTPGEVVSPGQPLMAIIPENRGTFHITAYFPMEVSGKPTSGIIKPGQYCEISLPDLPGIDFTGWVENINASGADLFALQNNAFPGSENSRRIAVRIAAGSYDPQAMPPLRPDMKAVVDIYPDRQAEKTAVNATAAQ